jgi:hypothetical protein
MLFSQVVVSFLHDHEEEYEISQTSDHSLKTVLKKDTGHCKICSLDIFHELYVNDPVVYIFSKQIVSIYSSIQLDLHSLDLTFSKSRAPPVIFIHS